MKLLQPQEVLRTILQHLKQQGSRAVDDNGTCLYRTSDGRKCAIGCLIPEDRYTGFIEGAYLSMANGQFLRQGEVVTNASKILPNVDPTAYKLLVDLQRFHDEAWEPKLPLTEGKNFRFLSNVTAVYGLDLEEALR